MTLTGDLRTVQAAVMDVLPETNGHEAATSSSAQYLDALKLRRTVYSLTDKVPISDDHIVDIVNQVIQTIPSAWNMQSTRILVALGPEHKRLWETIITAAKPFLLEYQGEEAWKRNDERFQSFRNAYGTVSWSHSSPVKFCSVY